jgi:DNA modification methylase
MTTDTIAFGDCRTIMRKWAEEKVTVQTCITSPPYFGLRDYGHEGQLGLEETPDQYVSAMVEVFRCVRDVLADDGTLWLNLGDSYAAQRGGTQMPAETLAGGMHGKGGDDSFRGRQIISAKTENAQETSPSRNNPVAHRNCRAFGLKHKDLIGIPWRVAFALQADGWYLRQDIIWHKPNPMPESVTDRCTKAHEYLFLLSKSERYYFDSEAIKEPVSASTQSRLAQDVKNQKGSDRVPGKTNGTMKAVGNGESRNRRSVWSVNVRPYKGAHFATFPPALIEPCILAGSKADDTVLDPFMGSGTTAAVAQRLGRHYLGCELNESYRPLQTERLLNPENQRSFSL